MAERFGFKWTVTECLKLQREYELLKLPIDEIASNHKRTSKAIIYKLAQEGFANLDLLLYDYEMLQKSTPDSNYEKDDLNYYDKDYTNEYADDEDSDDEHSYNLKNHVKILEEKINNLTDMLITQNTQTKKAKQSKSFLNWD